MPPKLKPDDLIDVLLDSRVVEALAKALVPLIRLTIEETVNKRFSDLSSGMGAIKKENTLLVERTKQLSALKLDLNDRLNSLEAYSRGDSLILRGLPEQSAAERAKASPSAHDRAVLSESHQSVEETVITLCQKSLDVDVTRGDISIAHRMRAGFKDKCRPVIVRFTNRRVRNMVYAVRKELKNLTTDRVYISKHLTKAASDLFFDARRMVREKKIFAAWTQNELVLDYRARLYASRPTQQLELWSSSVRQISIQSPKCKL